MKNFSQIINTLILPFREEYRQKCQNKSVIGGFHHYLVLWLDRAISVCPSNVLIRKNLQYIKDKALLYPQIPYKERGKLLKEFHRILKKIKMDKPLELPPKIGEIKKQKSKQNIKIKRNEPYSVELISKNKLYEPIDNVLGIGPKISDILNKLGIYTVEDLLYYLPRDYQDRRDIKDISSLQVGNFGVLKGEILSINSKRVRGGKIITKASLKDESGIISLIWFNQPYIQNQLKKHSFYIASGKVEYKYRQLQINNPEIVEVLNVDDFKGSIVPIYPLTEGISQKILRKIIKSAMEQYKSFIKDPFGEDLLKKFGLISLTNAINAIHFPKEPEDYKNAIGRLKFEEAFFFQLLVAKYRRFIKKYTKKAKYKFSSGLLKEFESKLPFKLTRSQKTVIKEIVVDMESPYPMNRLLQGDVGSGKTVICIFCAILTAKSGLQGAILAPTEVLAEQHFYNFKKILEKFDVRAELLLGGTPLKEKKVIKEELRNGEIDIIVGTHAILQEDVKFKNLSFALIDEQHKFGVMQRAILKNKGKEADYLFTTATPIPRSLSLTFLGDLDISVISEMPPGRSPVKTILANNRERERVYNFIKNEIETGGQVYVVCPLIEESEKIEATPLMVEYENIRRKFPYINIGLLHGRMKKEQKEIEMKAFAGGINKVLVTTTVVEVGVDVPMATIIVIMDANRYGLSQLHQLRGRVGRGRRKSYCVLVTGSEAGSDAHKRFRVLLKNSSGFRIAEEDLKIRGAGDFIGFRQSGLSNFKFINVVSDFDIIVKTREEAFKIDRDDPDFSCKDYILIKEKINDKYKKVWDIIH